MIPGPCARSAVLPPPPQFTDVKAETWGVGGDFRTMESSQSIQWVCVLVTNELVGQGGDPIEGGHNSTPPHSR